MNSNHQKKYNFSAISIKPKVATRFRKFSKRITRSHTNTLEAMMNFFDLNELSPNESLGANMRTLENSLKKRINALVAIIKDIEKNQTKPTNAMLELLFQENPEEASPQEELFEFEQQELITENEELNHYRNRYEEIQQQLHSVKYDLNKIVDKTTYVKGSFGGGYLKLDLTKEEFENIKQKL
ncbi:BfmA/BtgA family mobilization protein [Aureibaculum sp. 2210JD6-5]|uniref:BfmA/BtgA family mobilization protein n=1 Tax=Aureibaculum sp. 2210JD6-5 TaxID=3103957 RepID=UPI002AAC8A40|nr:BfmA/BtgA family mobilization protein [Aureibaculum sp. 2210JD6-5]MDY7396768.1 BfmA/BtgA family mobilization protein [Aureibaculum sp. 2210JD6-5]